MLKEYCEMMSAFMEKSGVCAGRADWKYKTIPSFLLAHGQGYEPVVGLPANVNPGKQGQCFKNAWYLSAFLGYGYVEGYLACHGVPLLHAWNVSGGRVIDCTIAWRTDFEVKDYAYFGVEFPPVLVSKTVAARGVYGMIDNPEQGWPLLREGMPG